MIYAFPFDGAMFTQPLAPMIRDTNTRPLEAKASSADGDFVVVATSPQTRLETRLSRGIFWNGAVGALGAGLVLFLWLMSERAIRLALGAGELAAQRLQSLSQAQRERDALYDQMRGALDALPASFIIVDRDDRLVLWNKAFEHVTGTPPGFIRRGMAYREILETAIRLGLIPEAGGDGPAWIDARIAARRRPGGAVAEGRRQGRWFLFTDYPTPDGGVVGLRYDITELKTAVARAEQAELLLNDALDSMSDAVLLLDPDDRLIGFNQTVTRTFPHPEDFRIGDNISEIARRRVARGLTPYTDRHLADLRASRHRLRYGDPPFTFEHRRSDGRWILTRQRRMASGGFISLVTDVTELREAQYLAVQAETVLREAINAMTDGWLLWNAEDRLVMFNAPAERLLLGILAIDNGMDAAAFVGALRPLLADERSGPLTATRTAAELLAERRSPLGLRCECRTVDGRWLSLREQPTRTGWTVSIVSDVTYHHRVREEIDRARQTAERSNEAKSRFLATASHDLRQPVHAVTLLVDALARCVQSDDERRIVGAVSESLRSIREMFNTLLYVSRLDAGKLEAAPVPMRIGDLLGRLAAETTPIAAQAGLRLRIVPSRAVVVSDPVLLESILRNFIGNAIKFTRTGGVLVGCRRRGARIRVEVWDTGPGIPADAIESVFEDFKRLPDPAGRPTEGMGLGLSIARRIADMLGYKVSVRSRPGRGSCFSVELQSAALDTRVADMAPAEVTDIAGARILVVDDDAVIVAALSTALEARGALVEGFSSVADTLAWSERVDRAPDYLLVDLELGGELNGIELVHRLTARFRRELVAVVLTGSTSAETAELLAEEDMLWLAKPIDADVIVETLGRARRRLATPTP